MKRMRIAAFGLLSMVAVQAPAVAQTYPMLMSLKPTAAQVGKSSVHTVNSRYSMAGTYRVLVSGTGVTGEVVKGKAAKSSTRIQIRFIVSADAMPGVRDFRLATPNGASTLGQLVIVRDPVVVEKGANNTPSQAIAVKLPATICGAIERNEDVDYFKFHAKAGQSITFHMRAMRLQDRIHDLQRHVDPIISLKNASGSTLAQSDNHYAADPLLTHRFDQDGEYYLEIRDVRYHGNTYWEYSVEATDRPYIAGVHPMGVAQGKSTPLEIVGRQLPKNRKSVVTIPGKSPLGPRSVRLKLSSGEFSNPVTVIVSDLPQTVESAGENNTPNTAQAVTVPGGSSGRSEKEADIDCYVFDAKKGERFTYSASIRSVNWLRRELLSVLLTISWRSNLSML